MTDQAKPRDPAIMEWPQQPLLLHQLPPAVRFQWIAKHQECFPELWATIPHEILYDELYTMDLREFLLGDPPGRGKEH
jgi:hypothetical protein